MVQSIAAMTAGTSPRSDIHSASIRPVWRPMGPPWIAKLTNPSAHAHRLRKREPTLLRPRRNGPVRPCSSRAMSHQTGAGGWTVVIAACADTATRAVAASRAKSARPSADPRSQVTPRLFTFAAIHRMERSLFSTSPTNGGCSRSASPPGGSTFTTSAPRSARVRPHTAPPRSARSRTRQPPRSEGSCVASALAAVAGEGLDPAVHDRLRASDLRIVEPLLRVDAIDRVDRPHEVVLVAVRHRRVDGHAALEAGVHAGPLLVAGGEALLRDERLADSAEQRIEDVGARVHPCREAPDDLVHVVDVDVAVDCDREAHALAARHGRNEEVAGPAVLPFVALLQLDDAAAPVGHRVWDVHVLHDARLQPFAELVDRRLADGRVDVVTVEHVHAEREDDRL